MGGKKTGGVRATTPASAMHYLQVPGPEVGSGLYFGKGGRITYSIFHRFDLEWKKSHSQASYRQLDITQRISMLDCTVFHR
jgi:hypothetical protein